MKSIGRGNTAEIFEYEKEKICKLFFDGYSELAIKREYENALCMANNKLPVPKAYRIINIENRIGIIYERLYGSSILDKIIIGEDTNQLLNKMCNLHKCILNCHSQEVVSYKEFLRWAAEKDRNASKVLKLIDELPEGDNLCHGDFHPNNIWINLDGSCTVIDFMNVCHGPWQYDVARTYFLISEGEIPNDTPDSDKILKMQQLLADMYLDKMNIGYEEIEKYILVIKACRNSELNLN
ncbi:aminoglycoside phosphotransferase family protein [Clostridium sp. AL.422]|uniref:aminoglycoside phosphotransferase family protein n=1 Tax=Clostridium TaxID=1485 RepID=UPI00293DEA1A|nr:MULTISPECIES: aminoglycoside phosphotransferase family protein [unclassified Clostridium]MDV4150758.1 aminoglycoside phosphotransferase family protein [Clostridium sp. AL.422]